MNWYGKLIHMHVCNLFHFILDNIIAVSNVPCFTPYVKMCCLCVKRLKVSSVLLCLKKFIYQSWTGYPVIAQSGSGSAHFHRIKSYKIGLDIRYLLILDGNSELGARVRSNLCYLICFRHLLGSRAVTNRNVFSKKIIFFHPCETSSD